MSWSDKLSESMKPRKETHTVWCVHWRDSDHGHMQNWFESKAEAEMVFRAKGAETAARIETVEMPKTKSGLVRWLNAHFDTDNG